MIRSSTKMLGLILLLAVILFLILLAALRWTPLATWLTNRVIDRFVEPALEVEIEIGDVGGDLLRSFAFEDIRVWSLTDRELVRIPMLSLEYDGRDLIGRRWRLKKLILKEPVLYLDAAARREPMADDEEAAGSEPEGFQLPLAEIPDFYLGEGKITRGRIIGEDGILADSLIVRWSLQVEDGLARVEIPRCVLLWPQRDLSLHGSASGVVISSREVSAEHLGVRTADSNLELSGRLGLLPSLSCSLQVRSDSISFGEVGRMLSQEDLPSGRLQASGRLLYDEETWSGEVETAGRVDRYRIDHLRAAFSWSGERLTVGQMVLQSPGVDVQGRGELLLGEQEPVFDADLLLRHVDLGAVIPKAPSTRLNGRLMAAGSGLDPRSLTLDAYVSLDSTMAAGYSLEKITGQFQYRQGILSTPRGIQIEGQGVRLQVVGFLDQEERLDISAQAEVSDVGRLFPDRPLHGALQARFQARGPLKDPRAAGQIDLSGLEYDAHRADRIRGSFGLSGITSRQDGFFALRFFDTRIGQVSMREGSVRGRLKEHSLFVDSLSVQGPRGTMTLAGRLDMVEDRLRLVVERWRGRIMEIDFRSLQPLEVTYAEERLQLSDVQISAGTGTLTGEADIGPGSRVNGRLHVEQLQAEWLSGLIPGQRQLSGTVSLDVSAEGALDRPDLEATLTWDGGRFDRLDFERFVTSLKLTGDSLSVEELRISRGGTDLRGGGYLFADLPRGRILPDRNWDLKIAGQGNDLNVLSLMIEDLQQAEGPFALELNISNTPRQPTYRGFFQLQNGTLTMVPLGNKIRDVFLSAHLDGQYLILDEFSAQTPIRERNLLKRLLARIFGTRNRGRAVARGRINLAELAFDLSVTGKRFYVEYLPQEVEAEADLDLRITGRKRPAITGEIDLRRALITRSMEAAPEGDTDRGPPPFDLDLTVDISKNCWLRNEAADIEIRGQLKVMQETGAINLLGTLSTIQGTYYFYGRSFRIDRGEVTFDRPEEINPQLDIAAWTQVDGERIDLLVTGRLKSPSVTLTSSSGYGEGDIISLLALQQTGTELDTLAAQEVVTRQAESIFGGYLQRAFSRKTGRLLGVETFRVQPDPQDRLNISRAELTVGTYLSSQFYVEYSRRLSQESGEQVGIEYSLNENLSLQGRRDKDGLYRLGVSARWRY